MGVGMLVDILEEFFEVRRLGIRWGGVGGLSIHASFDLIL